MSREEIPLDSSESEEKMGSESLAIKTKSVQFSVAEIREYEVIAEYFPSIAARPVIGLGWNYTVLPVQHISCVKTKSVQFSFVEIREYEVIAELNPSVTSGPGIGLGWNYTILPIRHVSDYGNENTHLALPMSRFERERILRAVGYSRKDLAFISEQIKNERKKRKSPFSTIPAIQNRIQKLAKLFSYVVIQRRKTMFSVQSESYRSSVKIP